MLRAKKNTCCGIGGKFHLVVRVFPDSLLYLFLKV